MVELITELIGSDIEVSNCIFTDFPAECKKGECSSYLFVEKIRSKPVTNDGADIIRMARRVFTLQEQLEKCKFLRENNIQCGQ